jgi:rhamnose utilization protein RhaD (predicted bifunctional aldolase and dehydrogenase)
MTHVLGYPANDYVILSEGNTSARIDEDTFWVKASGSRMREASAETFVRVHREAVLRLLEAPELPEPEVRARLAAAKVDPETPGTPSIETLTHALCLSLPDTDFVGHTHPTAVNTLLCAREAEEAFSGSLFPAEGVVLGVPLFVPYAPPGQPLGRMVREHLKAYLEQHTQSPRAILLQNHGLFALGPTPQTVLDVTVTMVKICRIRLGTYLLGGPHFVTG